MKVKRYGQEYRNMVRLIQTNSGYKSIIRTATPFSLSLLTPSTFAVPVVYAAAST